MIERIEVNLLPAEYRLHRRRVYLHREVVYPLLLVVLMAVGLLLRQVVLVNEITVLERQIAAARKEIDKNRHVLEEMRDLRKAKNRTREKIMALKRIDVNREKWVRLQETFCAALPARMWLSSIEEKKSTPPTLEVRGKTFSVAEVATYMSQLTDSDFIRSVDLSQIEKGGGKSRSYTFRITCVVNPDARLSDEFGQTLTVGDNKARQR
jgi:Tfp pilus assembly protein PilN